MWIEKSVTRVTDRHHEASILMPSSDPECRDLDLWDCIIAKFHRNDLDIFSHSRVRKTLS